jgi:ABC-2 type transport system permease protein
MKAIADIYATLTRTTFAVMLQYRAEMVIWLIGLVMQPVIYLVVWSAVAQAGGGQVGGYDSGDFAAYFIAMLVVNHLTFTWIMFDFEYRVRSGAFSPLLLQPLHPIHRDIVDNFSYKIMTAILVLPVAALLCWAFSPRFNTEPWMAAAFVPALGLSFLMRFFFEWCLALAAFWTTRTAAINQIYFALQFFMAGRMAPLDMMPSWLRMLAEWSPFPWMVAFPVELLIGRLDRDQALEGLMMQTLWLAASFGLLHLVWRRGAKRYSAVGA